MICFDGHVHIQERFSLDIFLKNALRNFSGEFQKLSPGSAGTFFLLLSEAKKLDFFSHLKHQLETGNTELAGGWQMVDTEEQESLLVVHPDWPENRLFMTAGRQIVTKEKLEVLALLTAAPVSDHQSLEETVNEVRNQQGLAVLPWGAGKWMGRRGRIVADFLNTVNPDRLFVGDNGGRPVFWPTPRLFFTAGSRGIRLIPGSDPLPLSGEELRPGSYGACIQGECSNEKPANDLRKLLTDRATRIQPYGRNMSTFQFINKQLALRLQ